MDSAAQLAQKLEQAKETFIQLRCVDSGIVGRPDAQEALQNITRTVKARENGRLLLQQPRRGCLWENIVVLESLGTDANQPGILPVNQSDVTPKASARQSLRKHELWRECESLSLRPHSFSVLCELPELKQIISHTAVTAITACAGEATHVSVELDRAQRLQAGSKEGSAEEKYQIHLLDSHADLLEHLCPAMRLCLAAEVAMGMLCPSQPAPPDTPEHAAALNMFVQEAHKHIHSELTQQSSLFDYATPSIYNTPARVQHVWSKVDTQQKDNSNEQHQQPETASDSNSQRQQQQHKLRYPQGFAHKWPLSPHIDLQIQLPPQQLLQLQLQLGEAQRSLQARGNAAKQQQQCRYTASGGDVFVNEGLEKFLLDSAGSSATCLPFELADLPFEAVAGVLAGIATMDMQQLSLQLVDSEDLDGDESGGRSGSSLIKHLMAECSKLAAVNEGVEQTSGGCKDGSSCWSQQTLQVLNSTLQQQQQQHQQEADKQQASNSATVPADAATSCVQNMSQADLCDMMSFLHHAATALIYQFMHEQWESSSNGCSAAWQQSVPMQVLLLLLQVQQLKGMLQGLVTQVEMQQQAQPEGQQQIGQIDGRKVDTQKTMSAWQAQQYSSAVQKVTGMLLLLRQFKQHNAQLNEQAADNTTELDDASSRGSSTPSALEPADFFSAAGPLATAGLWQSHARESQQQQTAAQQDSSSSSSDSDLRSLQECAWDVLLSTGVWLRHMQNTDQSIHMQLLHPAMPEPLRACFKHAEMSVNQLRHDDPVKYSLLLDCINVMAPQQEQRFDGSSCSNNSSSSTSNPSASADRLIAYVAYQLLPGMIAPEIHFRREHAMLRYGFLTEQQWAAMKQKREDEEMERHLHMAASTTVISLRPDPERSGDNGLEDSDLEPDDGDDSCYAWDEERWTEAYYTTDEDDKGNSSSSSSDDNRYGPRRHSSSSSRYIRAQEFAQRRSMRKMLIRAHKAYKRLCNEAMLLMEPLHKYHMNWLQQQQEAYAAAEQWWQSDVRKRQAVQGATAKQEDYVSSSSSSGLWPSGQHDYNQHCPLCQKEQQQQCTTNEQQQQQPHQCPPPANDATSSVPHYTDPFMWRRLMWQLLGKLSPAAQHFYVTYCNMCVHCTHPKLWTLVQESVSQVLWSPPDADMVQHQLSHKHFGLGDEVSPGTRIDRIKQYARALNDGFTQGHSTPAATAILAHQVLLSLSPLHHQLVPPAEVACYLPSSFSPAAVAKVMVTNDDHHDHMMMTNHSVMDLMQHESSHMMTWHLWWHNGVRRYWKLKQQQGWQGTVMSGRQATAKYSSSSSPHQQHCQAPDHLLMYDTLFGGAAISDELYMDPDARLYAVGFAARQLSGVHSGSAQGTGQQCAHGGSSSSSMSGDFDPVDATMQTVQGLMKDKLKASSSTSSACGHQDISSSSSSSGGANGSGFSSNAAAGDTTKAEALLFDTLGLPTVKQSRQMLQEAFAWPPDMLAPAAVRHRQINISSRLSPTEVAAFGRCFGSELLLQIGQQIQQQQEQGGDLAEIVESPWLGVLLQQVLQQQQLSDVGQLALHAPVPVDALVHPAIWWQQQQEYLEMNSSCDLCGKIAQPQVACVVCGKAKYCSQECRYLAKDSHAMICRILVQASQRYMCKLHIEKGQIIGECGPFSRLTELMDPLPGESSTLGMKCGGFGGCLGQVVPEDVVIREYRRVLQEKMQDGMFNSFTRCDDEEDGKGGGGSG